MIPNDRKRSTTGATMTEMGKHSPAEPVPAAPHRDHLWVAFVIAAAAAIEVCASWVGIGALSGFPVIRLPYGIVSVNTDFSLMVGMEAYSGYALYRWLACAPGRRSRPFAMWSAIAALTLSLIGQVAFHELAAAKTPKPPAAIIGFVSALPVIVVMLVAILVHLVHLDREEAEAAARALAREAGERAARAQAADERVALRAEADALRGALASAETARQEAMDEAAAATAQAGDLARKIDALRARKPGAKKGAAQPRKTARKDPATEVPDDVDARREALAILANEPDISGARLGPRVGKSARWGQTFKKEHGEAPPRDVVDRAGAE